VNAVMNLRVSFSGRTLLYEVTQFFTCAGNIASVSAYLLLGSCVSASQERHFFLCSQNVLKYADISVIEFQSRRRNILMKIHANIFVLKSSSGLKCFYCVSHLLLHVSSDLDNHFDFIQYVSVNLS